MVNQDEYAALGKLDQDILYEVVREAEERLKAQLQISTAADQRALSIAALQVTTGSGTLAGGVALLSTNKPDLALAGLAIAFAVGMGVVAHRALSSVGPDGFNIPGHRPLHWHPDRWLDKRTEGNALKLARIEQAAGLEDEISANKVQMDVAAEMLKQSIRSWVALVCVSAILLGAILVARVIPSIN